MVGTLARKPVRSDSPPVQQNLQLEVGCAEFVARQTALHLAAARAVASLPPENFTGLQLFLVNNTADEANDGWLQLSGHRDHKAVVFFELIATRIRHWFRKPTFRVTLAAYLPSGSLAEVISLVSDGSGFDEWEKQRDGREAMQIWATEVGQNVFSHAPGSRLIMR